MEQFEENPNPRAKIAFIIWTPFDFYVYKNAITHLPDAEFIISDMELNKSILTRSTFIPDVILLLKKHKQFWRILIRPKQILFADYFARYEVLVSLRSWWPMSSFAADDSWLYKKKCVMLNYGTGKDLVTLNPLHARFDVFLSEGPHVHELLSNFGVSHIVGVPKFDDWFGGKIDKSAIDKIGYQIDPHKKTLLYLPTYGRYSSLRGFTDQILALAGSYNLIIKLHYLNGFFEKEIVEKIHKSENIKLFGPVDDILPLFHMADAVISDSSSAALETILVDKPLIILDMMQNAVMLDMDELNDQWFNASQYYSQSIEQQIKQPEYRVGEVVSRSANLTETIQKSLRADPNYSENRRALRDKLFAFNDGRCGQRAADAIHLLLEGVKPEPTVLSVAIRSHLIARNKLIWTLNRKKGILIEELRAKIERCRNKKFE